MSYCLKLNEDGHIQYATRKAFASPDMVPVETLPEGNVMDYRYVEGQYVYDPLPAPQEPAEGSVWDDLAAAIREGVNSV